MPPFPFAGGGVVEAPAGTPAAGLGEMAGAGALRSAGALMSAGGMTSGTGATVASGSDWVAAPGGTTAFPLLSK